MHVTKKITMDLNNPRKRTVDLSQTDNVREVLLTVLADGLPYDMTEGGNVTITAMTVAYIKANGVGGEYATTHENPAVELVTNTTNRYKVRLDEHATDVPGHTEIFVKFKSGSLVLHSFPITLNVGKTVPENTDPNQPYFDVFVRKDSMAAATEADTGEVHYDAENDKLVYTPGSGGGSTEGAVRYDQSQSLSSSQKSQARTNIGAGTYSKPSGGVPKTDLASAVQTSLGKADSAYQKPSGGIPATDMAQTVQTALTAAGTAVQPAALNGYVPTSVFAAVTPSADLVEVKRDASTGKLYVLVNGSTPAPSGDSNTTLITMTESGSTLIASKTSSEIYTLLSGGAVNLVLIDYAGRQGTLAKKPISSGGGYTDAKFWAFDAENENVIEYAINSSGVVTYGTLALTGYYTKPSGGIPASDLAADAKPLIVHITQSGQTYATDTNESTILAAVAAGRIVVATTPNGLAYYNDDDDGATFYVNLPKSRLRYVIDGTTVSQTQINILDTQGLAAKTSAMNQPVGYRSSDGTLWTSPGSGGGGGVSKLTVTIRNSSGGYVSSHSPSEIAAAINNGDVVEVDCSGIMGWITGADASGASALSIAVDGGVKSLEMWNIDTDKSVVLTTQDIGDAYKPVTETLNGATPTISYATNNRIYKGGTLTSLTVNNLISNGMFMLIFDSGSTATNLVLPAYDAQHPAAAYIKTPDGFTIEANKHYELSINAVDGVGYLVGQGW